MKRNRILGVASLVVSVLLGAVLVSGFLPGKTTGGTGSGIEDVQTLIKICGSNGTVETQNAEFSGCLIEFFQKQAKSTDLKTAVALMGTWANQSSGLEGRCHEVSHAIGQWAYRTYANGALKADLNACGYGFGHGMLEAAGKVLSSDEIANQFSSVCDEAGAAGEELLGSCVHGFGHAIAAAELSTVEASKVCVALAAKLKNDMMEFGCMEGWAMGLANEQVNEFIALKDGARSYDRCTGITGDSLSACVLAFYSSWTTTPFNSAQDIPTSEVRVGQFHDLCGTYAGREAELCFGRLGQAASQVMFFTLTPEQAAPKVLKACDGAYADSCLQQVVLSKWGRVGRDKVLLEPICSFFPEPRRARCEQVMAPLQ